MSATYAPSSWPASPSAARVAVPVFARELPWPAGASGATTTALQWRLQRPCSLTPAQLGLAYGLLCVVSLAVGFLFLALGAPYVLGFAGLELLLVGVALLVFARHAADREELTLVGRSLLVELRLGSRVHRADFSADWLRVEPAGGQNSLIELSGQGRRLRVGRFLRPELRGALASELRAAVRRAGLPPNIHPDAN